MDKQIKEEFLKILGKSVPSIYAITGGMGISYGENKIYYEAAKKATKTKETQHDKNIYWHPLLFEDKAYLVCGIKSKNFPSAEIELLDGLFREFKYEIFLKGQLAKFADPKRDFVRKLITTEEISSMEQAIDMGDILGVNLRSPQAVILVKIPGFLKNAQDKCKNISETECSLTLHKECDKINKAISASFKKYDQNIITYLEPDTFIILKWATGPINTLNTIAFFKEKADYIKKITEEKTGKVVTVGVGQYYPGLRGLRKSYNDAKIALELGIRIWGEDGAYHIADIGMFVSLSEDISFYRKCELAHQLLGDIISDKNLYNTIKTFLECNMNLTDASKKLHLHRNTLIYRLDKVKQEIGLDPRKFSDAVQIKLGLMLYSPLITKCKSDRRSSSSQQPSGKK